MDREFEEWHIFRDYEDQGVTCQIPVHSESHWSKVTRGVPSVPTSKSQMQDLISNLRTRVDDYSFEAINPAALELDSNAPKLDHDQVSNRVQNAECRNHEIALFNLGLGNPSFTTIEREQLLHDLDGPLPTLDGIPVETENFILRWSQNSPNELDNIHDIERVRRTATALERAYAYLSRIGGREPYRPSSVAKIEVVFRHVAEGSGRADPPEGPLLFRASDWNQIPGMIEPTATHELFHKLQYSFGYRGLHLPSASDGWFFEGTASIPEVLLWNRVSVDSKLRLAYEQSITALGSLSYASLPFWLFGCGQCADQGVAIRPMLEMYEQTGSTRRAAEAFVKSVSEASHMPEQMYKFFLEFSIARALGNTWPSSVLDVNDRSIDPILRPLDSFLCQPGVVCNVRKSISDLSCHFYEFKPDPGTGIAQIVVEKRISRDVLSKILIFNGQDLESSQSLSELPLALDLSGERRALLLLSAESPRAFYELRVTSH